MPTNLTFRNLVGLWLEKIADGIYTLAKYLLGDLKEPVVVSTPSDPSPAKAEPESQPESDPEPLVRAKPRKPYEPQQHKTFHMAGARILPIFIDNPRAKTGLKVHDITQILDGDVTETTVRRFCMVMLKDGLLIRGDGHPIVFFLPDPHLEAARDRLTHFRNMAGPLDVAPTEPAPAPDPSEEAQAALDPSPETTH